MPHRGRMPQGQAVSGRRAFRWSIRAIRATTRSPTLPWHLAMRPGRSSTRWTSTCWSRSTCRAPAAGSSTRATTAGWSSQRPSSTRWPSSSATFRRGRPMRERGL